jgi:hypothetical protein
MVISGLQDGADIAGLRAAKACGIDTFGYMPKGFRTLHGPLDYETVREFNAVETESTGYPLRTRKNVQMADATIRLAHNWRSAGERATLRFIEQYKKPHFDVPLARNDNDSWSVGGKGLGYQYSYAKTVAQWLVDRQVMVVNVAGNGDESIESFVEWFLTLVFSAEAKLEGES